ncbi:hypothetical protein FCV25MIE_16027 [Fagus crenata]
MEQEAKLLLKNYRPWRRANHFLSTTQPQSKSYSFNGPRASGNIDGLGTSGIPKLKRRKRLASYNIYTKEGKHKSSLSNGFKWMKSKFMHIYSDG